MDPKAAVEFEHGAETKGLSVDWLILKVRHLIVPGFTLFFLGFALLYAARRWSSFWVRWWATATLPRA